MRGDKDPRFNSTHEVTLRVDGRPQTFTLAEVVDYYARPRMGARDIYSGCRRIGEVVGDWRPIDEIAREALRYFKAVNVKGLRAEAKRRGLTPTGF